MKSPSRHDAEARREAVVAEARNPASLRLVKPDLVMLPEYVAALGRGWSPTLSGKPKPRAKSWHGSATTRPNSSRCSTTPRPKAVP
jgi:hypothetical protein